MVSHWGWKWPTNHVVVVAAAAADFAPVGLIRRPVPIGLISRVTNTSMLRPLEVMVVVVVR